LSIDYFNGLQTRFSLNNHKQFERTSSIDSYLCIKW